VSRSGRARLDALVERERARFVGDHPASAARADAARATLLGGVPMNWMRRWPGPFPLFAATASGATVTDVDGREYADFCLGDTGAMCGHSPPAMVAAVQERIGTGVTMMLPTDDAAPVGAELARRFGLPRWQIVMSATDANRFALRVARAVTGRPVVVVFDWCYHGTVDETLAVLDGGRTVARPGSVGPPVDPAVTTRVVEWNDVEGLRAALAPGDVAAVLAEPALTNIGIVAPAPGFHAALRAATRAADTLLILDETHTLCAGPGGATARWGLEPDLLTVGKPIGGGIPAAAYGLSAEVAAAAEDAVTATPQADVSGIGGTLSGNALALCAIRATLTEVLTDAAFAHMEALADRWADGVQATIDRCGLPWHVNRLGGRAEYWFCPPPTTGAAAAAAVDHELDGYLHLACLNRGLLLTPFHNMALMSPVTTEAMVDHHTEVFAALVGELVAEGALT
jgi:glutamate-1-semialdehyde 2,1-aminomutase